MPLASDHRYTVISSDCHGGANIADYRPYLESAYHDEFDAWMAGYENPYDDVKGDDADRNWGRLGASLVFVIRPATVIGLSYDVVVGNDDQSIGTATLGARMRF